MPKSCTALQRTQRAVGRRRRPYAVANNPQRRQPDEHVDQMNSRVHEEKHEEVIRLHAVARTKLIEIFDDFNAAKDNTQSEASEQPGAGFVHRRFPQRLHAEGNEP